jgi:hypothetical protein
MRVGKYSGQRYKKPFFSNLSSPENKCYADVSVKQTILPYFNVGQDYLIKNFA